MKAHHILLCTFAACAGMTRAEAQVLYGATSSGHGELYILNTSTGGVTTDVGALNDASANNYSVSGLAFDPLTSVLYGSTGGASGTQLLTINPSTGLVTPVGSFSIGSATMTDLAFTSSGQLYGISSSGGANLYTINLSTGAATAVGSPSGVSFTQGGGLAISSTGIFYGAPIPGEYGTYNPVTGAYNNITTPASPAGAGGGYAALTFSADGSEIFGDNLVAGGSGVTHLVDINPTSGDVTDIGPSVNHLDAIAIEIVPEPGTMALMGIGALALLTKVRRK